MAFFNEFPHTRTYDSDLGWIIKKMKELLLEWGSVEEAWKEFQNQFPDKLADSVESILTEWLNDGTLSAIISDALGGWINVKEYGAVGDRWTDDTTAIQNAINAASIEKIGDIGCANIVFIPKGVYSISSPIIIPAGVHLIGAGINNTYIFLANNANCAMIKTYNYDRYVADGRHARYYDTNQVPTNFQISDLTFWGNKWNNQSSPGIMQLYGYNYLINNVSFFGYIGTGLNMDWGDEEGETWTSNQYKMSENRVMNCYFFDGDSGIYQSNHVNDIEYQNIFIGRQNGVGLDINGTSYWTNSHIYDCGRNNATDFGCKFATQGMFRMIIENMHSNYTANFYGWYQTVDIESYGNFGRGIQFGNSYSFNKLKINQDNELQLIYVPAGDYNQYNIIAHGTGSIFFGPINNSLLNIVANSTISLGQGGAFTNVSGNAIGTSVVPGAGCDNVWYPGKQ